MTTPRNAAFDKAVTRLARNMAIAQVGLSTQPAAALFELQVDAIRSALETVKSLLPDVPANYMVIVPRTVIGEHTADLLAEAVGGDTPDTVPDEWA